MQYQIYPEYKKSNIESFGAVPADWEKIRLKWTVLGCKNGVWGSEPDDVNNIYCIRVADFDRTALKVSDRNLTIRAIDKKDRKGRLLKKGDLLLEKSGGGEGQLVGAVSLFNLNIDAVSSNFIGLMRPDERCNSRYLTYLHAHLYSCRVNYRSIKQSTGIQNLDSQQYLDEKIFLPEIEEQEKIVIFLDHKTRQIDNLIEKKKALIEKLDEQRIAVITQAVTKGINGKTKMKPSGVDWLGDIPEHWKVEKLKYSIHMKGGGTPNTSTHEYWNGDIPWVSPKDMKSDLVSNTEDYITELGLKNSSTTLVDEGELLMVVRSGILRHSIPVSIAGKQVSLNQDMKALITDKNKLSPHFLKEIIWSNQKSLLPLWSKPGCTVESIETEYMANTKIALPPINEQVDILEKIKDSVAPIDKMVKLATKSIELYTTYRSALITNAVTGKIDLRNIEVGG